MRECAKEYAKNSERERERKRKRIWERQCESVLKRESALKSLREKECV